MNSSMDQQFVYLKGNVVVEPLFNDWYAWPYLIAPATAALYTANGHMRVMQSFVDAPELHVQALENPGMIGGPFLNYPVHRVNEIRGQISKTKRDLARLLDLASSIQQLERALGEHASGGPMDALYKMTPDALRGFIEFVYDTRHQPAVRWIEPLLYASPYYRRASQSLSFWESKSDERPIVFASPRLPEPEEYRLQTPFSDERVDRILALRQTAQPLGYARELFGAPHGHKAFDSLFTSTRPPQSSSFQGGSAEVRVRYFGHACVLIESGGVSILCDPLLSYPNSGGPPRLTYADLPDRIDFAVVTHNHQDHFHLEALLQLRSRIGQVIVPKSSGGDLQDPSLKLVLENTGFRNVREISEFESVEFPGGAITGLSFLGEHGDLDIRSKLAYLIRAGGRQIVCAADSNNLEPRMYQHIRRMFGPIDILFIGLECEGAPLSWAYGPVLQRPLNRKFDHARRLNGSDCDRALAVVESLKPAQVFVYAMGDEPWLNFIMGRAEEGDSMPQRNARRFLEGCRARGVDARRLYLSHELILEPADAVSV